MTMKYLALLRYTMHLLPTKLRAGGSVVVGQPGHSRSAGSADSADSADSAGDFPVFLTTTPTHQEQNSTVSGGLWPGLAGFSVWWCRVEVRLSPGV